MQKRASDKDLPVPKLLFLKFLDPDCDSGSDDESDDEKEAKPERKFGESEEEFRKKNWPKKGHDVSENKTVFVRNLSFNSDEQDLKNMMEENFGKVLFAKFVIDRATERPKGTAFVKFASEESANKCIAESVLTGANSAKGRVSHKKTEFYQFFRCESVNHIVFHDSNSNSNTLYYYNSNI